MKKKHPFLSTLESCVLWGVLAGLLVATAFAQLPAKAAQDFQKALEHFRRQDYSSALQVLSSMETQFPNDFDIQHLLAIVLDLKNQPQEANLHFRKAVELNPNSATAYTNYGASLMRLGKPEQAVLQFKRAVALEPGHATASFNLGTIFLGQGKPEEARSWLEQAFEAQPIYENGYQLAFCYFVLGNHLSAQRILGALEGVPQERAEFYFLRVLNEKALGRGQNASQVLAEVLPVLAEQPEVQDQVIMLLFSQGMYHEAIQVLELAVERFPDSYSAWLNLARARSALGEMTGAKEDASRALKLQETGEVHVLLGDISEKLEQPLVALEHYQQAVRLDPSETNLYALGYEFLKLIHPRASVEPSACLDEGVVVLAGAIVDQHVTIGDGSYLHIGSKFGEGCVIGANNYFSAGATFGGSVQVGDNNFFGINATIVNDIKIGSNNFINADSLVYRDVADSLTIVEYREQREVSRR